MKPEPPRRCVATLSGEVAPVLCDQPDDDQHDQDSDETITHDSRDDAKAERYKYESAEVPVMPATAEEVNPGSEPVLLDLEAPAAPAIAPGLPEIAGVLASLFGSDFSWHRRFDTSTRGTLLRLLPGLAASEAALIGGVMAMLQLRRPETRRPVEIADCPPAATIVTLGVVDVDCMPLLRQGRLVDEGAPS